MRPFLVAILFIVCFSAHAQDPVYREYDFSNVNLQSIDLGRIGQRIDSIWFSSGADSLAQLGRLLKRYTYTPAYGAIDFGYEVHTASLSNLNSDLASLGFGKISETFGAFIWGFTAKSPRWLYSFLFTIGTNNKSSNDEYTLKVSGTNIEFAAGYDIINRPRFQLYPQAAFGFQGWWIEADRKETPAPGGDLNALLAQGTDPEINKSSGLLTFGGEANYHLVYSKGGSGIILALKYGLTADVIQGKWKIDGEKSDYNSSDRIKASRMAVVVRFYFK